MRAALLLYPLSALAAGPLQRRQVEILGSARPEPMKSFKFESLPSTFTQAGAKRAKIWYGPFTLRAANASQDTSGGGPKSMDPAGTAWTKIAMDFPNDITILRATSSPVYQDGSRARAQNGVYTHHIGVVDVTKPLPEVTRCKNRETGPAGRMSFFIGNPEDDVESVFAMPPGKEITTGYYIKKGSPVLLTVDWVNYKNEPNTIYLQIDFDYIPGKTPGQVETSMQAWRLAECEKEQEYFIVDIPKGQTKFTLKSKEMRVLHDGYFFNGRGHIHDGGVNILAKLNGQEICKSEAMYGIDDAINKNSGESWVTIRNMTVCSKQPIKFKMGDTIVVEANYDFDLHPPRKMAHGGMSELMGTFGYIWAA